MNPLLILRDLVIEVNVVALAPRDAEYNHLHRSLFRDQFILIRRTRARFGSKVRRSSPRICEDAFASSKMRHAERYQTDAERRRSGQMASEEAMGRMNCDL